MRGIGWHRKTVGLQPNTSDVVKIKILPSKADNWKPPFKRKGKGKYGKRL